MNFDVKNKRGVFKMLMWDNFILSAICLGWALEVESNGNAIAIDKMKCLRFIQT